MVEHRPRRVFLSYAHGKRDQRFAERLAESLRAKGFETAPDERELATGANWALEVGRALERSDAIVVIVSKDSMNSPWTQREWEFAITSKKHDGRVLPVIMPGTPSGSVPWIMHKVQHVRAVSDLKATTRRIVSTLEQQLGAAE